MATNDGFLELVFGPMYSGKTSYLIELYKHAQYCNIPVLVINYAGDTRFTAQSNVVSHDNRVIPCMSVYTLRQVAPDQIARAHVLLVNEGQFFTDLVEHVRYWVDQCGKRVHVCGIDGDFKRLSIGRMLELVPYSDNVVKLKALCGQCRNGQPAIFSHRLSDERHQIVIGSTNYIPLCRTCFLRTEELHQSNDVRITVDSDDIKQNDTLPHDRLLVTISQRSL